MHLEYNGIDLKIVRVLDCVRTDEYDPSGQDYLWTRWRLSVEAVYSPQDVKTYNGASVPYVTAGSVTTIPEGGTVPSGSGPNPLQPVQGAFATSPPQTDVALRHKLMQPRGTLKAEFDSGLNPTPPFNQFFLVSPGKDVTGVQKPCDANNGPTPQECSATPIGNGRTFLVRYTVETCVNDCRPSLANKAILSNRWTATISYDDAYYATRTLVGLVIFRADAIRARNADPDQYRLELLPAVPGNCKRYIDSIEQSPDGFSYRYVVRDVEEEYTYYDTPISRAGNTIAGAKPRHIASIQGVVNRKYGQAGSKTIFDEMLQTLTNVVFASQGFESVFGTIGSIPGAGGGGAGAAAGAAGPLGVAAATLQVVTKVAGIGVKGAASFIGAANAVLPEYTETVVVEVRGTRLANRAQLQATALAAAFGQLTTVVGATRPFSSLNQLVAQGIGTGFLGGVLQAGTLNGILLAAGLGLGDAAVNDVSAIVSPATVFELEYDIHARRVRVTVTQSFSGLIDWVTGRTAGGWKAITTPLPETVMGGPWPFGATYNNKLNSLTNEDVTPPLPDTGRPLLAGADGPGRSVPERTPTGGTTKVMGTNLTRLIAADLLGECEEPKRYDADEAPTQPNYTQINGPWTFPPKN